MRRIWVLYLGITVAVGLVALGVLTWFARDAVLANWKALLFLAAMGAIAESQAVVISKDRAITVAFAVNLCALLMFGPVPAAWVALVSVLGAVSDFGHGKREHIFNTPVHKTLFNSASYILSMIAGGYAYAALGGGFLAGRAFAGFAALFAFIGANLAPLVVAILAYILVNTGTVALYLTFFTGRNTIRQWFGQFLWSIPSLFVIGVLGIIITLMYQQFGWVAVVLFFGPLMLARYTFVLYSSLKKGYLDTIKALSSSIEAKDVYTVGHSKRVEELCEGMATVLDLSAKRMETLRYAALLHDVGKIGIPEAILNKPGPLNKEEREQIRRHPEIGAHMLGGIEFLADAVRIIRAHHIAYDGSGYPSTASADGQLLEAQIICTADSYDAMTTDRPYRPAMLRERALSEIRRLSGTQFSPTVVDALERAIHRIEPLPAAAPAPQELTPAHKAEAS